MVHCAAGKSRSGAVVVEWLRRTEPSVHGRVDEALVFARARRALISPNAAFLEQLRRLEGAEEEEKDGAV